MAPVNPETANTAVSSIKVDSRSSAPFDLSSYLESLSLDAREALTNRGGQSNTLYERSLKSDASSSPSLNLLISRDAPKSTSTRADHAGAVNPSDINMKGIQALIAIIGASFVLGSIWFFFWAKNGGFKWRKNDWEEYKSTVLRRRGPNGTTLSNATKSTRLGGGSVVGQGFSDRDGYSDDTRTVITGTMTELTSSTAPIMKEKQSGKQQKKNKRDETAKEKKKREMDQAQWEGGHDDDVRAYRHEKVARVGGINKDPDALYYGTDYTETDGSNIGAAPKPPPHRSSRNASPEKRESRRDFSFQDADESTFSTSERAPSPPPVRVPPHNPRPQRYHSPSKQPGPIGGENRQSMPGSYYDGSSAPSGYTQPMNFNGTQSQNTKAYHHPIPGLNGGGRAGGGFRRDRGDGLDD